MNEKGILTIKSLKDQVYDYLRQQMSLGDIRPGSVLNLDATSRKLGISKTPLREALIMLEMEDFVTILPRKGVYVNKLTLQDIRDIYQYIGALEGTALVAAADQLKSADVRKMADLNGWMKDALDEDDFDKYYDYNLEFHNIYISRSGNKKLIKSVNTKKKRLYDFPRREGYVKEWEQASIEEHRQIVELIAAGKIHEAARFIQDVHWSFAVQESFILKYYQSLSNTSGLKGHSSTVQDTAKRILGKGR